MLALKTLLVIAPTLAYLSSPAQNTPKESELTIAVPSKLENSDPVHVWSNFELFITSAYCSPLTRINESGETIGHLLERWHISKDLKTYTLHIKKAVKFHDGTEVTSEDVARSLSRHFWVTNDSSQPRNLGLALGTMGPIKNGELLKNFEIKDQYSLKVTLPRPYLPFLQTLSHPALCILKKDAPDIGSGPMFLEKHEANTPWRLKRFDSYFGTKSDVSLIEFRSSLNEKNILKKLQDGSVDLAIGTNLSSMTAPGSLRKGELDFNSTNHLFINTRAPYFRKKRHRRSLGQLIQLLAWKENNSLPGQRPLYTLFPSGLFSHHFGKKIISLKEAISEVRKIFSEPVAPIHFVFIKRHFAKSFFEDLKTTLRSINLKFKIDLIDGPKWEKITKSFTYGMTHIPRTSIVDDPEASLSWIDSQLEKPYHLEQKLKPFRHLTDKNLRMNSYVRGLQNYANDWVVIPLYQKKMTFISGSNIIVPKSKYRSVFKSWRIQKN